MAGCSFIFIVRLWGFLFALILSFSTSFQTIITQVNHAIGASGVVSEECKAVVAEYGETIIKMLLAKVFDAFLHIIQTWT